MYSVMFLHTSQSLPWKCLPTRTSQVFLFSFSVIHILQEAGEQKSEMEVLKERQVEEKAKLEKRKKAIDIELSEIEPLVTEAKKAVGSIKSETLSEIRALRAPPDVIREILEGVLCIMGTSDTSWSSMRRYYLYKMFVHY